MVEKLKDPIGQPNISYVISQEQVELWILTIKEFLAKRYSLVKDLSQEQIDTIYRKDGWTVRHVIHHIADSHQYSYTGFKWTLTEDMPVIKAYYEERWAELLDSKTAPIALSLNVISALHAKCAYFLKGLTQKDLATVFIHPTDSSTTRLDTNIGIYAWHSSYHYEHINQLLIRENWK
jgi:hypothetical protein